MWYSKQVLILALAISVTLLSSPVHAQKGRTIETEQLKQAEKYFDSKNYEKALPLFSHIVSKLPDQPYYNYCLGVCLLKVDGDKAEAVRFLTTATTSPEVPTNAWLYLGMALHRAYRYEEAISAIQKYKLAVGRQTTKDPESDRLIMMCKNAINLGNDLSLLRHSILEEHEISRINFFTLYKNMGGTGRFLKLPKEYEQKQTRDIPEGTLLFLNEKGDAMVFTAPSKSGQDGLDIFMVKKGGNGLWMYPEALSKAINSPGDEAFPVLVNDGKTLYFSSRGDKSIGGYDVFRSEYNTGDGTWSESVSLGSPVNSPGDDFYYVPLPDNKTAYFASDRESATGKCIVYTASIIKEERSFMAIHGSFHCPLGLEQSDAKVTLLNAGDRSLMAQFRTSADNGTYFLKLPIPSKLIYQVKLPGFSELEAEVDLGEIHAEKIMQEINVMRDVKGKESVKITNRIPEVMQALAINKELMTAEGPAIKIAEKSNVVNREQENDLTIGQTKADPEQNTATNEIVSVVNTQPIKLSGSSNPAAKPGPASDTKTETESATQTVHPKNENETIVEHQTENKKPVTHKEQPVDATAENKLLSKADEQQQAKPVQPAVTAESTTEIKSVQPIAQDSNPVADKIAPPEANNVVKKENSEIALLSVVNVQAAEEKPEIAKENSSAENQQKKESESGNAETKSETIQTGGNPENYNTPPVANEPSASGDKPGNEQKSTNVTADYTTSKQEDVTIEPTSNEVLASQVPFDANDTKIAIEGNTTTVTGLNDKSEKSVKLSRKEKRKLEENAEAELKRMQQEHKENNPPVTVASADAHQGIPQHQFKDVIFKVQVGAFRDRSIDDLKKKYDTSQMTNLEYLKNTEGFLVVLFGNETNYESAVLLKEFAIQHGVKDAFVVVYSGENRLPISMVVFEEE